MIEVSSLLHRAGAAEGFLVPALSGKVFHIQESSEGSRDWTAQEVIRITGKKVSGWEMPELGGLVTDIQVSGDDRYLYLTNWSHGEVRQYDITQPARPRLSALLTLGGTIYAGAAVEAESDQPRLRYIKDKMISGSPHQLRLSPDGE